MSDSTATNQGKPAIDMRDNQFVVNHGHVLAQHICARHREFEANRFCRGGQTELDFHKSVHEICNQYLSDMDRTIAWQQRRLIEMTNVMPPRSILVSYDPDRPGQLRDKPIKISWWRRLFGGMRD